jgi:hypothetical protein
VIRVEDHGSVILLHPATDAARDWLEEHVGRDDGFQPYWPVVVCEPRYVGDIVAGATLDGLRVAS